MRMGRLWSVGLAVLLAVGGAARAQGGGEHRGPTSGTQSEPVCERQGRVASLLCGCGGRAVDAVRHAGWREPAGGYGSPDSRNPAAPRDASRIAAVCKLAGVTKIDNLVVTHYHSDHVGGLPQLVGMVPVGRFIDHGVNREGADVQGGASTVAG